MTAADMATRFAVMNPLTAAELQSSFVNCSKREAASIPLPELSDLAWSNLDFLAWRNARTPQRAYLIAPTPEGPVGMVFRIAAARNAAGAMRSSMCEFCHTVHSAGGVTLFTAAKAGTRGRRGDSVGSYFCTDLACSLYIRQLKRPRRVQPASTLGEAERIERLRTRLSGVVKNVVAD